MSAQDMNAIVRVKDKNGNVNNIYPATKIGYVEGLQTALNSKANASDVTSGLAGKVDKETGKVLSTNDYTTAEKNKLAGIAAGATANIGTVTQVKVGSTAYNPSSGVVSLPSYPTTLPASDVSSWAKAFSKPTYTASEVGAIATTAKGAASGVAELDASGKVPSSQLPSYVDDVLEYSAKSSFPSTGETGKIYVDTSANKTYRWSGSAYVEISASLALGETSSTAYAGDKGKTAYNHSQVTSGNPHNVTKSDVGLSNVGNFKAVSTVASQGLSSTEQANARANIGAGTSSFSGSYNDLSNKPTIPTKVSQLTNDSGYTTNTGTVTGVKVGSTSYSPSSGVVSLPAYPTSLPASDVSSWAKQSSKPSYTYSEVGAAPASHTHSSVEAKPKYTFDANSLPAFFDFGLSLGFVDGNSGYGSYGSVITAKGYYEGGGTLQLYAPYSPTFGGTHLKARFGNFDVDQGNSWTELKDIAWVSDIPKVFTMNDDNLTFGALLSYAVKSYGFDNETGNHCGLCTVTNGVDNEYLLFYWQYSYGSYINCISIANNNIALRLYNNLGTVIIMATEGKTYTACVQVFK